MGTSLFIKCHFLLLLIITLNAIVSSDSDKSILLQFKASVSDPSNLLWSWTEAQNHCTFLGVSCGSDSRVVALNVTGNGVVNCDSVYGLYPLYGFRRGRRECEGRNGKLGGNLPGVVAKLSGLKVLSLPFNGFVGEVPSEVWGMESLEVLDLEGNLFSGEVPGVGKNLRVLNLGFNRIRGEVPRWMGSLEVLNLAGNEVNGSVPRFIGGVREVYLGFNRIGGEVPSEIGESCEKLERLDLSGNFLTGGIPVGLGNCSRLREVLLYSNMFEEGIPVEFGKLKMLEILDVSRNSLSGFIPAELGNCSELSVVVLSNLFNPFVNGGAGEGEGEGEESSEEFSSMIDDFNYFQGGIPVEISTLPKLRILWVPRATLEGRLPSDWGSCGSLEMVNLAQNFFTGEIPTGLARCKKLHFLELSLNRLTGMLDADLQVPCMTMFDVSGNKLSGLIPNFYNGSCPPVYNVNNSSGFEPQGLASIYQPYLAKKALEAKSLQLLIRDHKLAVFHNFGSNNFTGTIQSMPISPERLGKQTAYGLFFGGNKFNGPLTRNLFEKCDRLDIVMVNVSSNRISGQMPAEIGTLCKSLVNLDVTNNQIIGPIPPTLWKLVFLVALNLSDNQLHGKLPSSFSQLKSLKYLSLATNKLSGPIPSGLGQLHSLEVLDLSSNSLSGRIPNDIVNVMNLTTLLLNNNQLSGQIPSGLANMTRLSTFNVSYNNLSGPLPVNRNSMRCSSFIGNPSLRSCRMYTLGVPSSDPQGDDHAPHSGSPGWNRGNKEFNSIEIASIASASSIVVVLIALIIFFIYTRKWKPKSKIGSTTRKEVTIFTDIGVPITYEKVVMATGNFNASNCIGNGGFGATYNAEISPGVLVAIKRLAIGRFQGVQQFHAEIKTLGRLRHPNLVTLVGYHAGETEMFLIYNYLPGGNLEKFILERSTRAVDWRVIHKIALDVARALAYLHDTCAPRVLHRDVKPSNILLDEDHNAYLSDFGLARLLGTSETHATTGVAGTFGYVAPEYAITCRVSDKADVYSYGVVLMELLSDKKVLDPSFSSYGNGFGIVQWACMLLRQRRAKEFFTARLWDAGPHDDLVEVLHLAVMCTVDSLSTRPTISQVVRRLKQLQPPSC